MTEFTDQQKRWLEGFTSGLAARKAATPAAAAAHRPRRSRSGRMRCNTPRRTAPSRRGGKLVAGGEGQAPAPSARPLGRGRRALREGRIPQGHRRLPDQVPRAVLRRAGRELLHVPAAHPQRHPERLADARPGRCRRVLRRRLRRRHDARQPADPRDPGQPCDRSAARRAGARPHLARLGRRQHPQHHRQPDRRHRPAGTDRHAAAVQRDASLHPQSPRDVRPAAQVQHRLRRRRQGAGAGGHQRHRLRRARRSARMASTSACSSAASPATRTSPARPACC